MEQARRNPGTVGRYISVRYDQHVVHVHDHTMANEPTTSEPFTDRVSLARLLDRVMA